MASLTVLCPTRDPGPRVRALLEPLRAIADEIVVAVDSRAGAAELGHYDAVADRVLRFERGPTHSALAWLAGQCRGDWVLIVAGDEVLGPALLEALPDLMASRVALQHSFSLRWLWPDTGSWLSGAPWYPDFHARLLRNDGTLRFAGRKHELVHPVLPHQLHDLPLWHLSLTVADEQARRAKVQRNQQERPGLRAAGGELNAAYYLPEDAVVPLARQDVPPADRLVLDNVLARAASLAEVPMLGIALGDVPLGRRADIEPLWAQRTVGDRTSAASLTPLTPAPLRLVPGESCTVYVAVRNDGEERWAWGLDQPPLFRVGYRWRTLEPGGAVPEPEGRAGFPHEVCPGETALVAVACTAPSTRGRWELELDVLLEHVRWFGSPCTVPVVVT